MSDSDDGTEPLAAPDRYDRILFPTDGTDASAAAREEAVAVAAAFDADLTVLGVVDVSAFPGSPGQGDVDRVESAAGAAVDAAAEVARDAGVTVEPVVEHGTPVTTILEHVEDVDLTVMGTHGRTGVEHVLVGSVTEEVIRQGATPVLAVHAEAADGSEGAGRDATTDADDGREQ